MADDDDDVHLHWVNPAASVCCPTAPECLASVPRVMVSVTTCQKRYLDFLETAARCLEYAPSCEAIESEFHAFWDYILVFIMQNCYK